MTSFEEGKYVVLKALEKAPLLNGKLGLVRDAPTGEGERYTVRLCESPCQLVNLKPGNMELATAEQQREQLSRCYDLLALSRLTDMVRIHVQANALPALSGGEDRAALVKLALEYALFPDPIDVKPSKQQQQKNTSAPSGDDDVVLPNGQRMKRKQMWDQADAMDKMTVNQMREQLRVMKSKSPQELRASVPQLRTATDYEIQAQISQLEQFVADPKSKKRYVEALRSGDFSKMDSTAGMDEAALRRDAKAKLALFRSSPEEFRKQLAPSQAASLSDAEIEASLIRQAEAKDGQALREMRSEEVMANMTDEQMREGALLQLKMFNENPKRFRKQMGEQAANLSDEEIRTQLEMVCKMDPKDVRNMQKLKASSGAGMDATASAAAAQQSMENMTGEQLSAMFKMQRDLLKRDPAQFRKMMPQANQFGMSDSALLAQLETMAEMDPASLKQYMSMTSQVTGYVNVVKEPLDRLTGGRGNYVLGALALLLLLATMYGFSVALYRVLAVLFPTTFGGGAAAAAGTTTILPLTSDYPGADAGAGGMPVQNDIVLEEEFFQQNDDL